MNTLNERLNEAREALVEVERAKRTLYEMDATYNQLLLKQQDAYQQLQKENKDVDKIVGISLSSFMATLLNNREEKIEKEEREAILAKQAYDAISYEVSEVKEELDHLKDMVGAEYKRKEAYDALLEEKKEAMLAENPSVRQALSDIEEKIKQHTLELKEVKEALSAARSVKQTSSSALESLNKAKNWGTYDMLGGGFIATMAKRDHMQSAQGKINQLNRALKTFNRELKDVNQYATADIEIDTYFKMGDWLFDGLFVDMMVQSKINDAKSQVEMVFNQSNNFEKKLTFMIAEAEKEIQGLNQEAEKIIVSQE